MISASGGLGDEKGKLERRKKEWEVVPEKMVGSSGFEPLKAKSQQIYSLSPLAARATPLYILKFKFLNAEFLAVLIEETAMATSSFASRISGTTIVSLITPTSTSSSSQ